MTNSTISQAALIKFSADKFVLSDWVGDNVSKDLGNSLSGLEDWWNNGLEDKWKRSLIGAAGGGLAAGLAGMAGGKGFLAPALGGAALGGAGGYFFPKIKNTLGVGDNSEIKEKVE